MVSNPTRRALLRSGGVVAAASLAGCSLLSGSSGSSDPDAGTDSYGVLLTNETEQTYTVTVTARPRSGGDPVFEETAESPPDEDREWDEVFTEEGQYLVEATADAEHFYDQSQQNRRTISVGSPVSPEIENVTVRVATEFDGITAHVEFSERGGQ
jgi:hypothetical protein